MLFRSEILMNAAVVATVRKTRGDGIDAACGQLAGQVQDRTRRSVKSAGAPLSGIRTIIPIAQEVHA